MVEYMSLVTIPIVGYAAKKLLEHDKDIVLLKELAVQSRQDVKETKEGVHRIESLLLRPPHG